VSEAKHTPGPWEWKDQGGYYYLVAIGDYGAHPNGSKVEPMIADDGSAGGEYSPSIDVRGADARLIAAAPDLLEACEAAREVWSQGNVDRGYKDERNWIDEALDKIDAAIAKATEATNVT
jgi:hypothetical protein